MDNPQHSLVGRIEPWAESQMKRRMAEMTPAQAAIWGEAIRLNKEGSEQERILAYADLCEMKGDQALDKALENAVRIYDPTECFSHVGNWFAAAAALRARAGGSNDTQP